MSKQSKHQRRAGGRTGVRPSHQGRTSTCPSISDQGSQKHTLLSVSTLIVVLKIVGALLEVLKHIR